MSGLGKATVDITDELDAVGNTTGYRRGFAIGSAILTVLALSLNFHNGS